jgi:hypothetical protein
MKPCSDVLTKHVYKNLFLLIIQYSDVGIDPEAEEEMETIQAFGRQAIEEEIEMNDDGEQEEDTALQVRSTSDHYGPTVLSHSSLTTNFCRKN